MNNKKKRIYSYILALFMTLNMTGCGLNKDNNDKVSNHDIYLEHFDTYTDKGIVEDRVEQLYSSSNVVVGINKETNKISRFIYYHGDASNYLYTDVMNPEYLNGVITELFDLDTGKLIYFHNSEDSNLTIGSDELNKLLDENDFYFLFDYYEDIDIEYKSMYTIEEINEIAKKFIARKENIKRLELSN